MSTDSGGEAMEKFDIDGVAGEPIVLPIGPGPATGHSWTLELPPGVQRLPDTAPVAPEPGVQLGAAQGSRMQVKAPVGEHTILARLGRPWEQRPVRSVRIVLHVR